MALCLCHSKVAVSGNDVVIPYHQKKKMVQLIYLNVCCFYCSGVDTISTAESKGECIDLGWTSQQKKKKKNKKKKLPPPPPPPPQKQQKIKKTKKKKEKEK